MKKILLIAAVVALCWYCWTNYERDTTRFLKSGKNIVLGVGSDGIEQVTKAGESFQKTLKDK
jgi:hypothetical protein